MLLPEASANRGGIASAPRPRIGVLDAGQRTCEVRRRRRAALPATTPTGARMRNTK
jgi:hypothetical protein